MNIIIDNREKELINIFNKNNNNDNIILKNLEIGDIIFEENQDFIYIIERKTFNDLGASIKDGRYKEQKIRLLSNSKENIYYILEGNIEECNTLNKKALLGSIINMIFRDNIKIIFSINIEQTYNILLQIKNKYIEGKFKKKNIEDNNYTSSIKLNKKDNMTKMNCNIIQLASIPGVSINISKIILDKYNTIYNLITEYKIYGENMLEKINLGKRNIGKKLSKKIYDYLID